MNDESRELRYRLGSLCERYNLMVVDKDTLDYRLGSNEPYGETMHGVNAEQAYEGASKEIGGDLRTVIIEMVEIGKRIRDIEGF